MHQWQEDQEEKVPDTLKPQASDEEFGIAFIIFVAFFVFLGFAAVSGNDDAQDVNHQVCHQQTCKN